MNPVKIDLKGLTSWAIESKNSTLKKVSFDDIRITRRKNKDTLLTKSLKSRLATENLFSSAFKKTMNDIGVSTRKSLAKLEVITDKESK